MSLFESQDKVMSFGRKFSHLFTKVVLPAQAEHGDKGGQFAAGVVPLMFIHACVRYPEWAAAIVAETPDISTDHEQEMLTLLRLWPIEMTTDVS